MSRVQLALNVSDVDAAVAFYTTLFGTEPAKRRPGYANFAIAEPPLKLVLIENVVSPGTLNHLGVEVGSTDEVVAQTRRLVEAGLTTATEDGVECCYAKQDKVWVEDPDRAPWEIYTVLADAEVFASQPNGVTAGAECCAEATAATTEATASTSRSAGGCC
jgi:catechol 2,3-dioxygenase-like lactoylglutathione lyase family enzyme